MGQIVPDAVEQYLASLNRQSDQVLSDIARAGERDKLPLVDAEVGALLRVLTLTTGATRVLEIGTAIGYSTLCLALGQVAGTITTIDPDADRTARARSFWRQAGIADDRIEIVNAPALEAFSAGDARLAGPFDLAFIDALKEEYPAYFEALRPRLAPGALLIDDNVLLSGRTSGGRPARPGDGTESLREFCRLVLADPQFVGTILPVGDGLLVAARRP